MAEALRSGAFSYRYPGSAADALAGIDLELAEGELCVLAGRSGSGKTTLMRAACGLVPHFHGGEVSGRLEICGQDVREAGPAELAESVAYVAQEPETQVVSTTVGAEIELPLELRGHSPAARARAVEEVALALAIPHLLDRATDSLSGGELQRVALAAALATRPTLLLLDEPTSQLDPVAGDELVWLLRRLNEEWGVTVLLSEHRLERCLAAADRVIAMDSGAIAFDGAPQAFLEWSLQHDPALATPAARMFDLAGIRPLPVGVRDARRLLAERDQRRPPAAPTASQRQSAAGGAADGRRAENAASLRDLWVVFEDGETEREVLRGIDLEVGRGERIALMGRNGAGKTTLLRALAGRIEAAKGRVKVSDGAALLPQRPDDMFVRERLSEELPGDDGKQALETLGLADLTERDPRDLSGGERQRAALAIVVAGRSAGEGPIPGLVLLDEPTRGMDRARKLELAALVDELCARGAAVMIATHDVEFAAGFAERVVLLGDGESIADGPAGELLSGGWYFSTEVARVLETPGTITAEQGAASLTAAAADSEPAARATVGSERR